MDPMSTCDPSWKEKRDFYFSEGLLEAWRGQIIQYFTRKTQKITQKYEKNNFTFSLLPFNPKRPTLDLFLSFLGGYRGSLGGDSRSTVDVT